MSIRNAFAVAMMVGLLGAGAYAAEEKGEGKKKGDNPIEYVLKHSADLKLTDEQKTKLQAASKETEGGKGGMDKVKAILSEEQMSKLKEMRSGKKKDK